MTDRGVAVPRLPQAGRPPGAGRRRRAGRRVASWRRWPAAGAVVHVVAPEVVPEIAALGVADLAARRSSHADLDDAWFVVAAATPEVNRQVADAAESRHVFVNAVDDLASASAYLGGVVRKGGVTLAISTDGQAPALAGLLREGLEAVLPDELEAWHTTARGRSARLAAARRPDAGAAAAAASGDQSVVRASRPGHSGAGVMSRATGHVSLVGAGPGDPQLLTRRAMARLRQADLVLYDALVPAPIVALARRAQRFSVGKRCGRPSCPAGDDSRPHDSRRTARPAGRAAQGRRSVRARAGRRGSAGASRRGRALRGRAGRLVGPGGTCPGRHPRHASRPVGRLHRRLGPRRVELPAAARDAAAALGHRRRADGACARQTRSRSLLVGTGWRPTTPVAVVFGASTSTSTTWTGTLATHRVMPRWGASADAPGTIVIGEVVSLAAVIGHQPVVAADPAAGRQESHVSHG